MATAFRPRTLILFAGDILFFALALWLSRYLRTLELHSGAKLVAHLVPFTHRYDGREAVLILAGMYESR